MVEEGQGPGRLKDDAGPSQWAQSKCAVQRMSSQSDTITPGIWRCNNPDSSDIFLTKEVWIERRKG